MSGTKRFFMVLGVMAAMAATVPAMADEVDKATADAMQQVITRQLDAFARGDATVAESFAAPGIKTQYPDPSDFVAMVQKSYAPLINPRSTRFTKSGTTATGPIQTLDIVAKDGGVYTALYTFEQIDGQWRISGCVLLKAEGTNV